MKSVNKSDCGKYYKLKQNDGKFIVGEAFRLPYITYLCGDAIRKAITCTLCVITYYALRHDYGVTSSRIV